MTNKKILDIALRQSAEDLSCRAGDFLSGSPVIVPFRLGKNARADYREPITCTLVSYWSNVVAAVTDDVSDLVAEYVGSRECSSCFETPDMNWLSEKLIERGHKICFMAEYFLPGAAGIPELGCRFETRVLFQEDFRDLYLPAWSHALCKDRRHLDVLGVGAYDGGRLIGLAACSADCEDMWQIGIDVLPEYRRQGIASALTGRLAKEILQREKVPFYCSAWSNIRSVRNAIRSGFRPAWVELTVKPAGIVDSMSC